MEVAEPLALLPLAQKFSACAQRRLLISVTPLRKNADAAATPANA